MTDAVVVAADVAAVLVVVVVVAEALALDVVLGVAVAVAVAVVVVGALVVAMAVAPWPPWLWLWRSLFMAWQAMNFVAKCLEGLNPPDSLPKSLQKPAAAAAPGWQRRAVASAAGTLTAARAVASLSVHSA